MSSESNVQRAFNRFPENIDSVIARMPIPLAITQENGDVMYFNQEFIEQFGYTIEDVSTAEQWWETAYPDPDYRSQVQRSWEEAIARAAETGTKIETQEWDLTIKDRTVRRVEFSMMPLGEISVIAMIDQTDRQAAEDEIRQQANNLQVLMDVTRTFTATLDLEKLFQAATDGIVNLTGLDSSAIYLKKEAQIQLAATTPPLQEDFPEHLREADIDDHNHIKQTLQTGQFSAIRDASQVDLTPQEKQAAESRNLKSIFYFPIQIREQPIGVLIVGSNREPVQISEAEADLCQTLTHHASLAIDNARNYQKVQQYAENLEKTVEERTEKLNRLVESMTGREVRMAELKQVIRKLRGQLKDAGMIPIANDPLLGPEEEWR